MKNQQFSHLQFALSDDTYAPGLPFCRVRPVKAPTRAHEYDAGIDFFIPDDAGVTNLLPGEAVLIPSGVKVVVPPGWALVFFNKSGVASRHQLDTLACVVDHGYQGEVHLNVVNNGLGVVTLAPGQKLLQGLMLPTGTHVPCELPEADLFGAPTDRGTNGFGSTGA